MLLSGPRPALWNQDLLTAERDKYGANDVKPGLTGWAQIQRNLSSFFEEYGYNTLLLKKGKKIQCPIALASMGIFSKEALAHKSVKKKLFIWGCKTLGLFKNITWSVTSELEADDVKRTIGRTIKYVVAEDLPRSNVPGRSRQYDDKIKIVFLSRICEHKNPGIVIDAIENMKRRNKVELSLCFLVTPTI